RLPGSALRQHRTIPSIAAKKGNVQSKFARLRCDQAHLGVVAGDEDAIRVLRLDSRKLRLEVALSSFISLLLDDLSPQCRELVDEILRKSDRVSIRIIPEHRDPLQSQVLRGELRHHFSLKRIDE